MNLMVPKQKKKSVSLLSSKPLRAFEVKDLCMPKMRTLSINKANQIQFIDKIKVKNRQMSLIKLKKKDKFPQQTLTANFQRKSDNNKLNIKKQSSFLQQLGLEASNLNQRIQNESKRQHILTELILAMGNRNQYQSVKNFKYQKSKSTFAQNKKNSNLQNNKEKQEKKYNSKFSLVKNSKFFALNQTIGNFRSIRRSFKQQQQIDAIKKHEIQNQQIYINKYKVKTDAMINENQILKKTIQQYRKDRSHASQLIHKISKQIRKNQDLYKFQLLNCFKNQLQIIIEEFQSGKECFKQQNFNVKKIEATFKNIFSCKSLSRFKPTTANMITKVQQDMSQRESSIDIRVYLKNYSTKKIILPQQLIDMNTNLSLEGIQKQRHAQSSKTCHYIDRNPIIHRTLQQIVQLLQDKSMKHKNKQGELNFTIQNIQSIEIFFQLLASKLGVNRQQLKQINNYEKDIKQQNQYYISKTFQLDQYISNVETQINKLKIQINGIGYQMEYDYSQKEILFKTQKILKTQKQLKHKEQNILQQYWNQIFQQSKDDCELATNIENLFQLTFQQKQDILYQQQKNAQQQKKIQQLQVNLKQTCQTPILEKQPIQENNNLQKIKNNGASQKINILQPEQEQQQNDIEIIYKKQDTKTYLQPQNYKNHSEKAIFITNSIESERKQNEQKNPQSDQTKKIFYFSRVLAEKSTNSIYSKNIQKSSELKFENSFSKIIGEYNKMFQQNPKLKKDKKYKPETKQKYR